MEIEVREAVPGDARRVRDVHLAAIETLGSQGYTDEQVAAWAHDRSPEDYPISDEKGVVGFGWMKPQAGEYFQQDIDGEITATYVHPSVSRQGVGSRIYAELEAEAIRQECDSLGLWASRNAVPFYESQGYERVTKHVHEYRESVDLTVVEMVKRSIR
jgi:putative acetyltransferase